jgi:preprotein translocase subunit SecG
MLTLGATLLVTLMATAFVLVSLFMMLVILIQKPKGGGLSGAFGGAGGSSQAAFGAKTGDLLTLITTGCFVAFLLLAGGLTYAIRADVAPKADTPPPVESTADPVAEAVEEALKNAEAAVSQEAEQAVQKPAETAVEETASPAVKPKTDEQP